MDRFWRALECFEGQAHVREGWRLALGDQFDRAAPLLRATGTAGSHCPRSDPLDPPRYRPSARVVRHGDELWMVPEDGAAASPIALERVLVLELDRRRLVRCVARGLGFDRDPESPVAGSRCTFRVGTLVPSAGFRFPVHLAFPRDTPELVSSIGAIVTARSAPFVLLAPTNRSRDRVVDDALERHGGLLLTLNEAIAVDDAGGVTVTAGGRGVLDHFLALHAPANPIEYPTPVFPTPAGARWEDVLLRFVDGHTVVVDIGGVRSRFGYAEMGMADRRHGEPTKQWELLQAFAEDRGTLDWDSRHAARRNAKRKQRLAERLRTFLRIEGDPFEPCGNGWRTRFTLVPDR